MCWCFRNITRSVFVQLRDQVMKGEGGRGKAFLEDRSGPDAAADRDRMREGGVRK